MITGIAKQIGKPTINGIEFSVEYDVNIWAAKDGQQIEFITSKKQVLPNYNHLWDMAKDKVVNYYKEPLFNDGAYTTYLDHLIIL